jgi:protein-S-isoprenylcysteine O-methyltransferase Ste14
MKMLLRMAPVIAVFVVLMFGPAGRLDVPAFWLYLALLWFGAAATYTVLERKDPALAQERMKPPSDRDKATRRLIALPFTAHLVLAGLDVGRYHWSHVGLPVQILGFVLVAASLALVAWTLFSNTYASSAVRIQSERDHKVISHGPYAFVRHPMYLAVVLICLGAGVALGSLVSAASLAPVILIFARRTLIEDRMLHDELPGYRDYAARVRWRIVPGLF